MADLKIVIGGDARQLQEELKKSQAEIRKTAIEANKLDSSLKKTTASAGQSIFNLTEKLRTLQSSVFTEKDRLKIASYNKEIKNTEIEIAKLNALGTTSGGAGAFSGIASGAGKAFSAVRQLAYILPGVGIAGIIGFATEPIAAYIGKLFEATEAEKKLAQQAEELKKFNEETAKNYGKEISTLEILRGAIESTTLPMAKRLQAIKDLRKEFPGLFDGLTNEQLLTGKVANAYDLAAAAILRKAKAQAASSRVAELAGKQLEIDLQAAKDLETTTRLIAEAKASKGSSLFGGAGSTTVGQEQAAALNIFNKKQALRDAEKADLQKQLDFYLKIAVDGADQTIKVEEKKAEKVKKIREKSTKDEVENIRVNLPAQLKEVPTPVIYFRTEILPMGKSAKNIMDEIERVRKEAAQRLESFKDMFASIGQDIIVSFAEGIGNAVAGKGFSQFFQNIFASVGAGLKKLGIYFLAGSKLISQIKKLILTIPALSAVAAIGLIALGTAIQAGASKNAFATGVRNFGGGTALVGERGPELVQLPAGSNVVPNGQLNAMSGGGNAYIMETVIRGQDLAVVLKRANQTISRNG
jgi:hypothetical protein